VNPLQRLTFFYIDESSAVQRRTSGTTFQIHIKKLDVLVSACAKELAVITSFNGGHPTLLAALIDIKKQEVAESSPG